MVDRRLGVARTQISTFNPSYQIRSNCDGTGDIEFDFWGARKTWYYDCGIQFQVQSCVEESFGDCSPASPLLPHNHFYSNLSPASRIQAIEQGRKEMMEMIRNMPESSYELSLKDLVEQQLMQQEAVEKDGSEDKSFHLETEAHETKKKKKKKAVPICRSGSMDADSLKIKMFFPSSLSFKKKSAVEHSSKVSPAPSREASLKPADKQWWIKRIFIKNNNKNREDSSRSRTSRHAIKTEPCFLPACWPFFLFKRSKDKRQGDSSI